MTELTAPSSASARPAFWFLTSMIALVAVGKCVLADTMDPDAFWHLRVAEQLSREGIGPIVDNISFASLKAPWTPYSWLAELFMKWTWDVGGYRATIVVTSICVATFIVALAAACVARTQPGPRYLCSIVATAVGAYFTLAFISFRPVTFALALMAVMVAALQWDRGRFRDDGAPGSAGLDRRLNVPIFGWVWVVVPLTALLTNLHLYGAVMALIVLLTAVGAFFDDRPRFKRQSLLALATIAAACCTPMLRGAVETSLRYNTTDPMVASNYITEMRPFYWGFAGKVALAMVIGIVLLAIRGRRKLGLTDWLLLGFGVAALFRLGRFAPVFALLAMPILAHTLPTLRDRALTRRPIRYALIGVLAIGAVSIISGFPYRMDFDTWLNRHNATYPTRAAAFVEKSIAPRTGKLINEFNWGGYLAWRLGDKYQVLMDGRTQLYADDFWRKTHLASVEDRTAFLSTIDADAAVVPHKGSAFLASLESLGWVRRHEDDLAIVLLPPSQK